MQNYSSEKQYQFYIPKDGRDTKVHDYCELIGNKDYKKAHCKETWLADNFYEVYTDLAGNDLAYFNNAVRWSQVMDNKAVIHITLENKLGEFTADLTMNDLMGRSWLVHELIKQVLMKDIKEDY